MEPSPIGWAAERRYDEACKKRPSTGWPWVFDGLPKQTGFWYRSPMTADRKFQITYTMTPWDYAAMTRAITRRPWHRNAVMLALWLFCVWGLVAISVGVFNPLIVIRGIIAAGSSQWPLAVLVLIALLFSIFSHWFNWAASFLYYRQLAAADATVTMALTDETIEGDSTVADMRVPWAAVKRLVRERDYLFLPVSKRESFILPRRSFETEAQFEAAASFASERISASRMS